jgi:hypothetical protein
MTEDRALLILGTLRRAGIVASLILLATLIFQLVTDQDFAGLPFLFYAIALVPIAFGCFAVALMLPRDRPAGTPE